MTPTPRATARPLPYPDISRNLIPAYAYANNIFFAYSNHCGYEALKGHQWHYRGNSIVAGPHGDIIVAANHQQDTLLVADIIPAYYGPSHPESDYLKNRRPRPVPGAGVARGRLRARRLGLSHLPGRPRDHTAGGQGQVGGAAGIVTVNRRLPRHGPRLLFA